MIQPTGVTCPHCGKGDTVYITGAGWCFGCKRTFPLSREASSHEERGK